MSLTPAERVGLAGVILLGAALVATAVLIAGSRHRPEKRPETATGTTPREPEPAAPGESRRVPDLRREIQRLRQEIARRDARLERLERLLAEAGVSLEPTPLELSAAVKEAIERLRACGPETSPADVEALVKGIVELGAAAVEPVEEFLAHDIDIAFSDAWSFYGNRFTAHPSLRIALIDALRRIGEGEAAVEGQAALVTLLRKDRHPLEIGLLVSALSPIEGVPEVDEVVLSGAKRFLTLPPDPRERYLLDPVLAVLAKQEPEDTAEDYLAYYLGRERPAAQAAAVLPRIAVLPPPVAAAALERAVKEAPEREKKDRAARRLARLTGPDVHAALRRLLPEVPAEVRSAIYETISKPPAERIARLERSALGAGLEALSELDRFDRETAARKAILGERRDADVEPAERREIDAALLRLAGFEERGQKLHERLGR